MIGLVCAAHSEVSAMERVIDAGRTREPGGGTYVVEGELYGTPVAVLRTATCGKIGAAAGTQLMIERYQPGAIICFGAAGSLTDELGVGDVVVAERLVLGDSGIVHGKGFRHTGSIVSDGGPVTRLEHYLCDPALLGAARAAGARGASAEGTAGPRFGTIVTCDQVILSRSTRKYLNETFSALVVDMESAAVAQVAYSCGTPFLAVKAVSDGIGFTAENLEAHLRGCGESRAAHWLRSARYLVASPGSIGRIIEMRDGMAAAARNSADMVARILDVLD